MKAVLKGIHNNERNAVKMWAQTGRRRNTHTHTHNMCAHANIRRSWSRMWCMGNLTKDASGLSASSTHAEAAAAAAAAVVFPAGHGWHAVFPPLACVRDRQTGRVCV